MSYAKRIADHLNDLFEQGYGMHEMMNAADSHANSIGVGLYWLGTASVSGRPICEVWAIDKHGKWTRKIGSVHAGFDNIWRA